MCIVIQGDAQYTGVSSILHRLSIAEVVCSVHERQRSVQESSNSQEEEQCRRPARHFPRRSR